MAKPKSIRVQRVCRHCGAEFEVPIYRAKHGHGVMCRACAGASPEQRFWRKVDRSGDCWLWTGGSKEEGYGVAFYAGRLVGAHRVSWMLTHGDVPAGLWVLHRCDNPRCVNPAHLFLGTHVENMADMRAKGRARGGPRRLTADAVRQAHALIAGGVTQQAVADSLGVSRSAIANIVQGHSWKSLQLKEVV